jgi:hypothetical protein
MDSGTSVGAGIELSGRRTPWQKCRVERGKDEQIDLLDRYRFSQISRLIHVGALENSHMVGE